ncbi:MAG: hypothetical protein ABIT37_14805, partial [Luteolibacter sp.]
MKSYPIALTLIAAALVIIVLDKQKSESVAVTAGRTEIKPSTRFSPERDRTTKQRFPVKSGNHPNEHLPMVTKESSDLADVASQTKAGEVAPVRGRDKLTAEERVALDKRIDEAAQTPDTSDDREVMRQMHALSLTEQQSAGRFVQFPS